MQEALSSVDMLLIEDMAANARLTLRALEQQHLANRVTWVKDGAEALDYIYGRGAYAGRAEHRPKLILLDLKLPKVDGIEVLRQIKADEQTRSIPVVVLTSSAEESDIVRSYRLGVNSYIVKPVDFSRFSEVVANVGLYWMVVNRAP